MGHFLQHWIKFTRTYNYNNASAEVEREEEIERRAKNEGDVGWPYKTMLIHKAAYAESWKLSTSAIV